MYKELYVAQKKLFDSYKQVQACIPIERRRIHYILSPCRMRMYSTGFTGCLQKLILQTTE